MSIPISLSYKKKTRFTKIKDFGVLNLVWNKVDEDKPIILRKEVDFENIKTVYKIRISDCKDYTIIDEKEVTII